MSRNRFVTNETVRLQLSDDDWIEIKKELNVMERKKLEGSPMSGAHQDTSSGDPNAVEMSISWDRYFLQKLTLYIVEWSLLDEGGKHVKVTRSAIENLRDEDADEMMDAIKVHEEAMDDMRSKANGAIRLAKN